MDIQQTAEQLQKFADAHGLNMDCSVLLDQMDSGDYIELNGAIDNSDNHSIMQILQKYKARLSESYGYFTGNILVESYGLNFINSLSYNSLEKFFKENVSFAMHDNSHLTIAEMKTIAYDHANIDNVSVFMEDNNPQAQLTANIIANANTRQQQTQVNPQTQAKMKQAELQRNSGNNAMKVTVPGNQSGTNNVATLVGVDPGPTEQQTLVVTKDPQKQNQVNVYGLDDVNPVDQQGQINMTEEYSPQEINQDVMAPSGAHPESGGPSPLTVTEPGIGGIIQAIAHIESEDNIHGDESPMGNQSMNDENDIIAQIIDNCSKMRGR